MEANNAALDSAVNGVDEFQKRSAYQILRVINFKPDTVTTIEQAMQEIYAKKENDELNRADFSSQEAIFYMSVSNTFKPRPNS